MRTVDAFSLESGFAAAIALIPPIRHAGNVGIAITTPTGTRLYERPAWSPSLRRLVYLVWSAELNKTCLLRPGMYYLGYTAYLRPAQ